tara:strand:- start:756 stop:1064 length:309 start_codon:yes stop_codon:yes gene_type:complete
MNKPIEINGDCPFLEDLTNNNKMAMWNLITSKQAVKLFSKGIKPNRFWRLKDVKFYFGIKGNTETIYNQLVSIHESLMIASGFEPSEIEDLLSGKPVIKEVK